MPDRKVTQAQRVKLVRRASRDLLGHLGKLDLPALSVVQAARVKLEVGALLDQLAIQALQVSPAPAAKPERPARKASKAPQDRKAKPARPARQARKASKG